MNANIYTFKAVRPVYEAIRSNKRLHWLFTWTPVVANGGREILLTDVGEYFFSAAMYYDTWNSHGCGVGNRIDTIRHHIDRLHLLGMIFILYTMVWEVVYQLDFVLGLLALVFVIGTMIATNSWKKKLLDCRITGNQVFTELMQANISLRWEYPEFIYRLGALVALVSGDGTMKDVDSLKIEELAQKILIYLPLLENSGLENDNVVPPIALRNRIQQSLHGQISVNKYNELVLKNMIQKTGPVDKTAVAEKKTWVYDTHRIAFEFDIEPKTLSELYDDAEKRLLTLEKQRKEEEARKAADHEAFVSGPPV